jgi:flagellar biosynthesis protein FlhB
MADISLPLLLQELQTLSLKVLGGVLAVMLVIAIIDYILQRLMFMMKMRMSRSELKEEYKQSEGDPPDQAAHPANSHGARPRPYDV